LYHWWIEPENFGTTSSLYVQHLGSPLNVIRAQKLRETITDRLNMFHLVDKEEVGYLITTG
jgi:hypothetical protein